MLPYAIGLDIGVASVGWAAVALDHEEQPCAIIDLGTRIFTAAENPKTGASLAAPRREKRSLRRRLRRHRHRNERIRSLLVSSGLISEDALAGLFDGKLEDIYTLRVKALDEPLTNAEFARVLIHMSQHRGFRSNRIGAANDDEGALLSAISENAQRMRERGYRTAGEMLLRDPMFAEHKRNKGGGYLSTVSRDMTEDEVHQIFAAQRRCGVTFAGDTFEKNYLEILLSQRSFDEGPGGNSHYGGEQILNRVGNCTLIPGEKRAAKATYTFEYFNLLERINHIRLISEGGEALPLTPAQRSAIIELAHKTEKLDYSHLRKALALSPQYTFNMVRYADDAAHDAAEKKAKFSYLKSYHQMRRAIDALGKGRFAQFTVEQRDAIGTILTCYKSPQNVQDKLCDAGFEPCDIEALSKLGGFSKFGHLSVKACRALIPFLEQGMNYNDACAAAGFDFRGHSGQEKSVMLHPQPGDFEDVTSPVVRRALAQSIKVLNAIIRKQGCSPTYINIELARELAKTKDERNKISRAQEENRAENERLFAQLENEFHLLHPTGQDLVKLKLWQQQDGISPYSQRRISIERLFEPGYAEVDHIVPYSISFDDSYKNKVLVLAKENRDKGNRLPLEYLTGKEREDFIVWVNSAVRDYRKKKQFLKEHVTPDEEKGFRERSLQDTKTMSVFLMNYIRDNLAFAPSSLRKKRVTAVNGIMTSYMRKRWGIAKIREDGDLHHAVDALCVVCTTDAMIRQLSRYSVWRECEYVQAEDRSLAVDPATGEVVREFPHPWPRFRDELEARTAEDPQHFRKTLLSLPLYRSGDIPIPETPVFVSRMPRRKISGAAHKETVKSPRMLEDGFVIVKKPLSELKLKNGEIDGYYNPQSDRLLYEALKARLALFGGDGKKAFSEPFFKPKHDGSPGPRVDKVKLCETATLSVPVHGGSGVADNDSMVRIDVFHVKNDGYYFVPIYVADTLKPELPNKACVAHKPYEQWKEMREGDFVFSLYPDDLVHVVHKRGLVLTKNYKGGLSSSTKEGQDFLLYYGSANISSGAITCVSHDGAYIISSLGIKTLAQLEKYTVDVLGQYHPVAKEPRQTFRQKRG